MSAQSSAARRTSSRREVQSPDIKLRPWQQEAFGIYRDALARGEKALLWEATPGAGKTTAALVVCLHQLRRLGAAPIVIVVPTAHLKVQWARAALRIGLHLDASFSNANKILSSDYSGLVVTYQQVAQAPSFFRRLTQGGCAVLDEVHHAGDGLTWGHSLRHALADAKFVLCLSGTPFRSDSNPIPFVAYDDHGISVPDYSYGYSRAVEEGVCRPTAFFTYGGEVSWTEGGGEVSARFTDPLDPMGSSRRLRAALDVESGWIHQIIRDAHTMLTSTRREHRDAGGLLVAPNQTSARKLAKLIHTLTGVSPCVVLSEESEAAKRLKAFRDSSDPWLVACNMVSEGVDIPRLRVGVYATTVRTKMYFRQFLGRIVRRIPDLTSLQVAYCYLPADPTLVRLAEEIENEVKHCIQTHNTDEELPERQERAEKSPESQFQALQSVNSGLDSVIVHGNQLALFAAPQSTEAINQVVHQHVAARLDERRSKSEEKAELTQELRKLVNMYHKRSGRSHAQVHQQLNQAQKLKSQTHCTELQLRERIILLKKWFAAA